MRAGVADVVTVRVDEGNTAAGVAVRDGSHAANTSKPKHSMTLVFQIFIFGPFSLLAQLGPLTGREMSGPPKVRTSRRLGRAAGGGAKRSRALRARVPLH